MDHYSFKDRGLYSVLAQVFQDVKYGVKHTPGKWNNLTEKVDGTTMRMISDKELELTYHHYEITTLEELAQRKSDGAKFVESFVKELKKEFLAKTGKTLKLKKIKDEDPIVDKHGRIYADVSSAFGGRNSAVSRYLVRDRCIYEFSV